MSDKTRIHDLAKKYGKDRLEKACLRAEAIGGLYYRHLASILASGVDGVNLDSTKPDYTAPEHNNVRGADYYH